MTESRADIIAGSRKNISCLKKKEPSFDYLVFFFFLYGLIRANGGIREWGRDDWSDRTVKKLFSVEVEINVFNGADGVAGGDVVLVVQTVCGVAGRPDAQNAGHLRPRVNLDAAVIIKLKQIFYKENNHDCSHSLLGDLMRGLAVW